MKKIILLFIIMFSFNSCETEEEKINKKSTLIISNLNSSLTDDFLNNDQFFSVEKDTILKEWIELKGKSPEKGLTYAKKMDSLYKAEKVKYNDFPEKLSFEDLFTISKKYYSNAQKDSLFIPYGFKEDVDNIYVKRTGLSTFKYSHEYFVTHYYLIYRLLKKEDVLRFKKKFDSISKPKEFVSSGNLAYKYKISEDLTIDLYINERSKIGTNERHEIMFYPKDDIFNKKQ